MNGGAGASQRAARWLTLPRARAHAVVVVGIFAAVYAFGILRHRGLIDAFGHSIGVGLLTLRTGARIVRDGCGADLYDVALQETYWRTALGVERLPGMSLFTSPPFVALLYVPWALIPQAPALLLWTGACLAALAAALRIMARCAPLTGRHWPDALVLSLSFYPILEGLMAGSNSLLAVPIFALVLIALRAGREASAGALLGLLFYRPQLALAPVIVFAAKRRWRVIAGAAAVGAGWAAASVLFVGWRTPRDFLALGPLLSRMIFEPGMPSALFCSIYAFFLLPLGPARFGLAMALGSVVSLGLLALVLWVWRGPWDARAGWLDLRFAALLVVTPLVSPYLQLHDVAVLVLPALLVSEYWLGHGARAGAARRRGSGAAPLPFRPLLGGCLAAAAPHPLLDLLNPYGLRPLLPFDRTWCYGDLAGIRDPWMWLILGGSALLLSGRHAASVSTWTVLGSLIVVAALRMIPAQGTFGVVAGLVWIAGAAAVLITWLRGVDPHARRAIARGGLAVTVLYVGCLVVLHQRAMSRAYAIAER